MQNPSTNGSHSAYSAALDDEQAALDDALAAIREETRAGRVSPAEAAAERATLLAQHLARLEALRAEHLGDDGDGDLEAYCAVCGGGLGIFTGHGGDWCHFRGNGTADSPNVLYDAGHAPEVAWRPAAGSEMHLPSAGEGQQA